MPGIVFSAGKTEEGVELPPKPPGLRRFLEQVIM